MSAGPREMHALSPTENPLQTSKLGYGAVFCPRRGTQIGENPNNVRARRKELGLSQEELADRAHVHRTFIGHVERAESNISIDNISRISEALEVPASELLRSD